MRNTLGFKDPRFRRCVVQRFYNSTYGRFMSPDPYKQSGGPTSPGSWNRYSYTQGDPVNFNDASGLARCSVVSTFTSNSDPDSGLMPITTAEVQCVSYGGSLLMTQTISFDGNWKQAVADAESSFGSYLDQLEGIGQFGNTNSINWDAVFSFGAAAPAIPIPTGIGGIGAIAEWLRALGNPWLSVLAGSVGSLDDSDNPFNKPRPGGPCVYVGETAAGPNGLKTCYYRCPGYGSLATFGCPASKPCPPVDANGWVHTW